MSCPKLKKKKCLTGNYGKINPEDSFLNILTFNNKIPEKKPCDISIVDKKNIDPDNILEILKTKKTNETICKPKKKIKCNLTKDDVNEKIKIDTFTKSKKQQKKFVLFKYLQLINSYFFLRYKITSDDKIIDDENITNTIYNYVNEFFKIYKSYENLFLLDERKNLYNDEYKKSKEYGSFLKPEKINDRESLKNFILLRKDDYLKIYSEEWYDNYILSIDDTVIISNGKVKEKINEHLIWINTGYRTPTILKIDINNKYEINKRNSQYKIQDFIKYLNDYECLKKKEKLEKFTYQNIYRPLTKKEAIINLNELYEWAKKKYGMSVVDAKALIAAKIKYGISVVEAKALIAGPPEEKNFLDKGDPTLISSLTGGGKQEEEIVEKHVGRYEDLIDKERTDLGLNKIYDNVNDRFFNQFLDKHRINFSKEVSSNIKQQNIPFYADGEHKGKLSFEKILSKDLSNVPCSDKPYLGNEKIEHYLKDDHYFEEKFPNFTKKESINTVKNVSKKISEYDGLGDSKQKNNYLEKDFSKTLLKCMDEISDEDITLDVRFKQIVKAINKYEKYFAYNKDKIPNFELLSEKLKIVYKNIETMINDYEIKRFLEKIMI